MKLAAIAVLLFTLGSSASAQDKKNYEQSAKQVFAAALSVAKANYAIESVDDKNEIINIHTGHSFTSNGFYVTVAVDATPLGCTDNCKGSVVNIRGTKAQQLFAWGAGGRIAKKIFKQIDDALAKQKS